MRGFMDLVAGARVKQNNCNRAIASNKRNYDKLNRNLSTTKSDETCVWSPFRQKNATPQIHLATPNISKTHGVRRSQTWEFGEVWMLELGR